MGSVAIITARGGSKRIPGKNVREFCGRPIIEYSIEAALESGLFEEVMVSTDSKQIAEVSLNAGAKVPFMRSPGNATDTATTAEVLAEVIKVYANNGRRFDDFCCLFPCAPFVTADDLREAKRLLQDAPAVVPVVSFSHPPQRALVVRDGTLSFLNPDHELTRTQDLETMYHDCAQFFFQRMDCFERYGKLVPPGAVPYFKSELVVQDIDNYEDWAMAEIKYRLAYGEDSTGETA